jgi:hypothetical protein
LIEAIKHFQEKYAHQEPGREPLRTRHLKNPLASTANGWVVFVIMWPVEEQKREKVKEESSDKRSGGERGQRKRKSAENRKSRQKNAEKIVETRQWIP